MKTAFLMLLLAAGVSAQGELWLRAGKAHLGTGATIAPAVVHLKDGRVAAVGSDLVVPEGAKVIDLGDGVLAPGFVDGLSYLGLARGPAENEEGREVTPSLRVADVIDAASDDLEAALRLGVTTLAIHPGARNVISGLSCLVKPRGGSLERMLVKDGAALRITLGNEPAAGNLSPRNRLMSLFTRRPNSRMGVIYDVREAFGHALKYRARKAAGLVKAPDKDLEVLVDALEGRIAVHWVARASKDIRAALRISEEFAIPRNVILEGHEAGECAAELRARNVPVLVGPVFHPQSRGRGRFFADGSDDAAALAAQHAREAGGEPPDADGHGHDHAGDPKVAARIRVREELGIRVPLNADEEELFAGEDDCCGAPSVAPPPQEEKPPVLTPATLFGVGVASGFAYGGLAPGDSLLDYARFGVRAGLDPARAIPMLTLEAAKILGIADRVGSIESGKDADLVAFSSDPLSPTSSVTLVILDGRVVHDARPMPAAENIH